MNSIARVYNHIDVNYWLIYIMKTEIIISVFFVLFLIKLVVYKLNK